MDPTPVPSATVVLLRDAPEGLRILLVRRSARLAFHGGAWVFPGGRIDDGDGEAANAEDATSVARQAAVRELREEASLDVSATDLVWLSRWTTPVGRPRRFLTWFFVARHTAGATRVDGGEITDAWWPTAREALEARDAGRVELPPPTFVTVSCLREFQTVSEVLAHAETTPPMDFVPRVRPVGGGVVSLYAEDAAYEGADLEAPGPRHRLVMGPSQWKYERSGAVTPDGA